MKVTRTTKKLSLTVIIAVALFAALARPHCQIPCGIYDDQARLDSIAEHIVTIEKSMKMITTLTAEEKPDMNQIVRWVQNKDDHADEIAHIVTYYFMAQRLSPVEKSAAPAYEKYVNKLGLLHQMLVYSMKAKQTTNLANVKKLESLLAEFKTAYVEP